MLLRCLQSKGSKGDHGDGTETLDTSGAVLADVCGSGSATSTLGLGLSGADGGSGGGVDDRRDNSGGGLNNRRDSGGLGDGGLNSDSGLNSAGGGDDLHRGSDLGGGRLRVRLLGRVLAELLGGRENLVDGNVGATLLNDTRGSGASDVAEVLADTGEVGLITAALAGDSIVEARNGALGDVAEGLSLDGGNEGSESERVLHFEGGFCGLVGGFEVLTC